MLLNQLDLYYLNTNYDKIKIMEIKETKIEDFINEVTEKYCTTKETD